jgi:hypothetical protein
MSDPDPRMAEIARRLEDLSSKDLDRRLRTAVEEGISKWERRRGALIAIILAVLGVATYTQLTQQISSYFASSVVLQIDKEVKTKTAGISTREPAIGELSTRLADLEQLVSKIATAMPGPNGKPISSTSAEPPAVPPPKGFAFFGVRNSDGSWSERYFRLPEGGDRAPQPDDRAVSEASVNVRDGYIVYGPSGWTNQRGIGALRRGESVKIVEAREVVPGFWWISFVR